ncbi:hypothetical protein AAF712_012719 [Marasmius tenuissimus]|uniref:histidine kinase n=1 Tax=Marasmius tenuissimus TaxID=585030 RepID=A0ABR2ZFP7_9AGAR
MPSSLPPPAVSQTSSYRSRSFPSRVKSMWFNFSRRIHAPVPLSASNTAPEEAEHPSREDLEDEWKDHSDAGRTEKVVVEQSWATSGRIGKSTAASSDPDPVEIKSGATPPTLSYPAHDKESAVTGHTGHGFWGRSSLLVKLRYRMWPTVVEFFFSRPFEGSSEEQFRNEDWQSKKMLALVAAVWFAVNWGLGLWFVPRPLTPIDKVAYYGVRAPSPSGVKSQPSYAAEGRTCVMLSNTTDGHVRPSEERVMVLSDLRERCCVVVGFPNCARDVGSSNLDDRRTITSSTRYTCGTYNKAHRIFPECPTNRDFIGLFYYTIAYPTVGLFALKMNRFTTLLGVITFFVMSSALMIPDRHTWIRSMANFLVFHAILLYVHNIIEKSERRMFSLRLQVKVQFKATQRAQINERKTAESKYRLTSYVFHEVRVPLNAALLAVQNMEASGTVSKDVDIEFDALMGSLRMMSQVLNDVLDFNKIDSGQFELVNRPYVFHQAMRSMFIPLRLTSEAKKLNLITTLDPNIDLVARRAAYQAMDEQEDAIQRHLKEHPDVDGVVIGDEARFRQIVTNLASNACKFTPEGGTVSVTTRLILPSIGPDGIPNHDDRQDTMAAQLSASKLVQHNIIHSKYGNDGTPPPTILIRIEVSDTGCGIEQSELTRGKLFSAFNQTEKGRQQGGKGTGLGLALVKNIVKLSGGRLGVSSEVGKGSTFWVELPLGVGRQALIPSGSNVDSDDGSVGEDLAKIRSAARLNESPAALSHHNTLPLAVDAAALSASEISSMPKPSALTHSMLMEQGGNIELVVHRQESLSSGFSSLLKGPGSPSASPLPTPATEKSAGSSRLMDLLSFSESPVPQTPDLDAPKSSPLRNNDYEMIQRQSSDSPIPSTPPPPPSPPSTSQTTGANGRPNFISLPSRLTPRTDTVPSASSTLAGPGPLANSSMAAFDRSFDRTSSSVIPSQVEFDRGLPVLVVDDDKVTRMMMARMLSRLGCDVCTAENGEVALKSILESQFSPSITKTVTFEDLGDGYMGPRMSTDEEPPDPGEVASVHSGNASVNTQNPLSKFAVVFLDNQMPTLSGLRTVEILRRLGRRDYVIGLTGNALLPDQEEYLKAGVDVVLTKPVSESSIKNILKQADLRRKRHTHRTSVNSGS